MHDRLVIGSKDVILEARLSSISTLHLIPPKPVNIPTFSSKHDIRARHIRGKTMNQWSQSPYVSARKQ